MNPPYPRWRRHGGDDGNTGVPVAHDLRFQEFDAVRCATFLGGAFSARRTHADCVGRSRSA